MSPLPPGPIEVRRDLLWLLVGSAILYGVALGARDLWNPNEPLYGQAVVEMARRGDWLVPTVNGEVFGEKPILYYWLALVCSRILGGVSELSLRIPSALAGSVGVLFVYLLTYPYAGRTRARLAAGLFATTFVIWWTARSVQMDLLLTVCTLGTVLSLVRATDGGIPPLRGWCLAGLAAGLGFLAKGPVALICPALVFGADLLGSRRLRSLRPGPILAGGLVFLAVAAPWYAALWARGESAFLYEVLYRQNVVRFLEPWDHQAPWWYYLVNIWIDMAPWALLLPLAVRPRDREDGERRIERLAWTWILVVLVFFSLAASKRSPYIQPVAPAVAILVAGVVERYQRGSLGPWRRRTVLGVVGLIGAVLLISGVYIRLVALPKYPPIELPGRATALLFLGGGAAVLAGVVVSRRNRMAAPAALLASLLCAYLLAGVWLLPAVNVYKSPRAFCKAVNARVPPGAPLLAYRPWRWRAEYVYYTGRRIERIEAPDELRSLWSGPERIFVLVEGNRLAEARAVIGKSPPLARRHVGAKEVCLFSNH